VLSHKTTVVVLEDSLRDFGVIRERVREGAGRPRHGADRS
jgi:hypothetical protein